MKKIKDFAKKVCEYTVSEDMRTISGRYEREHLKFDLFEMKGSVARLLHKELIKIEDSE